MELRKTCNLTFLADSSIVFICGMPGSGKSTFASKFLKGLSVIDIDDIYDETEVLLNLVNASEFEHMLLADKFMEVFLSRLRYSVKRSLRKNPITFVIANVTDKKARQTLISEFNGKYKNIFAIVLDISKETLIKQYKNDKHNKGMDDLLSNFNEFKNQIDDASFEEFDIVYVLDEKMVNSVTVTIS